MFYTAPGEDFSRLFAQGLLQRHGGGDAFALARVQVIVNTRRTGRRIAEILAAEGARLLPRITPVAELARLPAPGLPPPVSGLRRRLEILAAGAEAAGRRTRPRPARRGL